MADIRIGTSGWSYDHWRGNFYPEDLPQSRRLEYLARRFNSVEINGSFYGLLSPQTYVKYLETAPGGFVYAVKGSQFITHAKKLKDVETPLANFFASGVLRLEAALGPILWQFPRLRFDLARVEAFLELLPEDTRAAARLARRHDERVAGRSSMTVHVRRPIRYALEFRHESFMVPEVVRWVRDRGVALATSQGADAWRCIEEVTADFVYLRLHGASDVYASEYGPRGIDAWGRRIEAWAGGGMPADAARITELEPPRRKSRDVYVYFDNDARGHAPHDARRLMERLGVVWPPAGSGRERSPGGATRGEGSEFHEDPSTEISGKYPDRSS